MNTSKDASPVGYSHIIAGAGIGLLVGLLVGLSLSPVVGVVLGGLTALLAAFLGLSEASVPKKLDAPAVPSGHDERARRVREYRTGVFGAACSIGVIVGLLIRTNNLLGISAEDQYQAWLRIGFTEPAARQLVAYEELGLLPEGMAESSAKQVEKVDEKGSVLYAGRSGLCRELAPEQYRDVDELLSAWQLQSTGQWQSMAEQIVIYVPTQFRRKFAETAWGLACEE